mgnify:CR=1 FL=1
MPDAILSAESLDVYYGDAVALTGVSLTIGKGELLAVVGPNGAGKTTLINTFARLLPIRAGRLTLEGADVTRADAQSMCDHGVAIIPEGRRLFVGMTVEENLEMGCYRREARRHRDEGLERVYSMFPILRERRNQIAGTMSGGQQQMVAIGRALMSGPKLLLLDEPSAGLAPVIVQSIFEVVRRMSAEGYTVLIVEQNIQQVLKVVDRAYLLETGRIRRSGPAAELLASEEIRKAYLGV